MPIRLDFMLNKHHTYSGLAGANSSPTEHSTRDFTIAPEELLKLPVS